MKDDKLYIVHIQECLQRIESYVSGGKKHFLKDSMTQDAVLRNLQTMAESSMRLSDSFKEKQSDIDWKGIAGFRNVLVHDYLGINLERVWNIIEKEIPGLQKKIEILLEK